jgi:hypothetical protein
MRQTDPVIEKGQMRAAFFLFGIFSLAPAFSLQVAVRGAMIGSSAFR